MKIIVGTIFAIFLMACSDSKIERTFKVVDSYYNFKIKLKVDEVSKNSRGILLVCDSTLGPLEASLIAMRFSKVYSEISDSKDFFISTLTIVDNSNESVFAELFSTCKEYIKIDSLNHSLLLDINNQRTQLTLPLIAIIDSLRNETNYHGPLKIKSTGIMKAFNGLDKQYVERLTLSPFNFDVDIYREEMGLGLKKISLP